MSPAPSSRSLRGPSLIALLVLVAGIIWFRATILPSSGRVAAAKELRDFGFEAGAPGKPKQGFRAALGEYWRNLTTRSTPQPVNDWADRARLMSSSATSLDPFRSALTRFQPKEVLLGFCSNLSDVSALQWLPSLERLDFYNCPNVTDFTVVTHFPHLRQLTFFNSPALQNLACLRSSPKLESLHITNCATLGDLSDLNVCKGLRKLWLIRCPQLQSVEPLSGLPLLKELDLSHCHPSVDLKPLHGLKNLKQIRLTGSVLPGEAIAALRAALPGATIFEK